MAIPLAIQAAGSVANAAGGLSQSNRMREQTDEELRRMKLEQDTVFGQTQAAGAASGIEFDSGSLQSYLTNMSAEFTRQLDWTRKTGYRAAKDTKIASIFQGLTGLGSAVNSFAAANNYFKTPKLDAAAPPTYQPGFGMPPWRNS